MVSSSNGMVFEANADAAETEIDANSGTSLEIRTQIFKQVDGEWVAAESVTPGEHVKARVFIKTDYYAGPGDVLVFYDNDFFEDAYIVNEIAMLSVNESETSFTGLHRIFGVMVKHSESTLAISRLIEEGYITEAFAKEHTALAFQFYYEDSTVGCQIITDDEWFAEFDLKVKDDATGMGDFFCVEETVANPGENYRAYITIPRKKADGTTANDADSMHLWEADVTLVSNPVFIEGPTTGRCGEKLIWNFDESTGMLVISGEGDMYDYEDHITPWHDYRSSINSVVIEDGVTGIGEYAFGECTNLTSITIPDGVTRIGDAAFDSCTGLTSVTIPESVTSIGVGAFNGCIGLTSITVDSENAAYSSDEYGVLFNKDKTELIQYPAGNTRTSYEISDNVTTIGLGAFSYCTALTNVTIPESVTSIGVGAFINCTALTSVTIPDGVTSINTYTFVGCSGLQSITIPDSVTRIGVAVFNYCYNLFDVFYSGTEEDWNAVAIDADNDPLLNAEIHFASRHCGENLTWNFDESTGTLVISGEGDMYDFDAEDTPWYGYRTSIKTVVIEDGITSIGERAFYYCDSLTSITIPDTVLTIGDYAFTYCHALESVKIGNGVTSIGEFAFCWCNNLTDLTIGNSVKSIDYAAFAHCTALTSVTIPDSVETIGEVAFSCCKNLASVTIGNGVTNIGELAFSDSDKLASITVNSENAAYSSDEYGVLFNKDKTELIQYPAGNTRTSYAIPDGVISIDDYAFAACINLTTVTIPDSVTDIGKMTFGYCIGITSVTIGNGITRIADMAFSGCDNLTDVYYSGTEDEWKTITIAEYNEPLLNAVIHCKNVLSGENGDVCVEFMDGAVEGPADVNVTEIAVEDLKEIEHNFEIGEGLNVNCVYDITLVDDDGNNIPNDSIKGKITVKIKLPDKTSNVKKIKIIHYSKDGTKTDFYSYGEKLEDRKFIVENNEYIVFEVDHFSYFFVCLENDEPAEENDAPTVKIHNNHGAATINYGDMIMLQADVTNMPEDAEIWWYVDGEKRASGEIYGTTIKEDKEISVKILDSEGNPVKDENGNEISDTQKVKVKDNFWLRIISFFKNVFRINRVVVQSLFNGIK